MNFTFSLRWLGATLRTAYKSLIVTHYNQTDALPGVYRRYLMNTFRDKLQLVGTPVRLEFKSSSNPFEKRKPKTPGRSARTNRNPQRVRKSAR